MSKAASIQAQIQVELPSYAPYQTVSQQAVQRAHALRNQAIADAAKAVALAVLRALDQVFSAAELAVHRGLDRLQRVG